MQVSLFHLLRGLSALYTYGRYAVGRLCERVIHVASQYCVSVPMCCIIFCLQVKCVCVCVCVCEGGGAWRVGPNQKLIAGITQNHDCTRNPMAVRGVIGHKRVCGEWCFSIYGGQRGFDLATSAR